MKLLAWDTSSKAGAIVALESPPGAEAFRQIKLISEWSLNVDSQHAERLLWGIHQVLESARWRLSDVDVFAVGVGPGSFTGLRIGVTTARTLAHTLSRPLLGVSSLAALARPAALASSAETWVIASTDAAKGELFSLSGRAKALLKTWGPPFPKGVTEEVSDPEVLAAQLKKKISRSSSNSPWIIVGEGKDRYPEAWKKLPAKSRIELPAPFSDQVQGRFLGMIAWEAWRDSSQREAPPALSVYPRYLRASDAEVKLKAGLLPPLAR